MASNNNNTVPKTSDSATTSPTSSSQPRPNPLADLGLKLKDTASVSNSDLASSVSSRGGRRRRRNRKNGAAVLTSGIPQATVLPRIQETKPVRLQLGLNLDVELELKAHLEGDVSISLLAEKKYTPRKSAKVVMQRDGTAADKDELFHIRLGKIKLRQRWIDREISHSLTLAVAIGLVFSGFVVGFMAAQYKNSYMSTSFSF